MSSSKEYRQSAQGKATRKKYRERPEVKAKEAEYNKRYTQSKAGKDRLKRFRQTDKYKESCQLQYKNYSQSVEGRARLLCAAAKKRALAKNLPYTITSILIEEKLRLAVCEVTGMTINFCPGHPNAPSLDQKNPGEGYTEQNVQLVTWWYNRLKSNMTDAQAISLIKEIQSLTL